MTESMDLLRTPRYYEHYRLPVKMVRGRGGGLCAWRLSADTGGWNPANHYIDEILFAVGGEVDALSRDEFVNLVEQRRARYLKGEGPIFALYEVIDGITDKARAEHRKWTPTESALISGLRRKTYAMFEAELVRRGDPGADVDAAREVLEESGGWPPTPPSQDA